MLCREKILIRTTSPFLLVFQRNLLQHHLPLNTRVPRLPTPSRAHNLERQEQFHCRPLPSDLISVKRILRLGNLKSRRTPTLRQQGKSTVGLVHPQCSEGTTSTREQSPMLLRGEIDLEFCAFASMPAVLHGAVQGHEGCMLQSFCSALCLVLYRVYCSHRVQQEHAGHGAPQPSGH